MDEILKKIQEARSSGYSDSDIANHLSKTEPKIGEAIKEGYSLEDVVSHLSSSSSFDAPSVSGSPVSNPNQKGTLLKDVINSPVLPIVGGVVGGIAGSVGGPMGSIGGAGLGGAAGESYRQLAARGLNLPVPQTSLDAAKDIGIEGATQAAGEAMGPVAKGVGKGVMKLPIVGSALEATGEFASKTAGQLFQLMTKIKPEDASTLFKNPKAILPGQWDKAQKAWRTAAQGIGIPIDEVSPEMIKILSGDAKKMVFETYGKLIAGESVGAAEAQTAKQALDIAVMPVAKTVRKNPLVNTLNKIRQAFTERIGQESPEMAAANKDYAIAATGRKFRSLFPVNTTGDPAYFRSSVLPTLIGVAGAERGQPLEGAAQGAAFGALTSPLALGSTIALAGGGRVVLPYLRRPITASLAELAKQKIEGK